MVFGERGSGVCALCVNLGIDDRVETEGASSICALLSEFGGI